MIGLRKICLRLGLIVLLLTSCKTFEPISQPGKKTPNGEYVVLSRESLGGNKILVIYCEVKQNIRLYITYDGPFPTALWGKEGC